MSSLGDVVMLSHVRINLSSDCEANVSERHERLLMLFPGLLTVLSITSRVSGYVYKASYSFFWHPVVLCIELVLFYTTL